ncbi:Hsp33 family molecular chaperone HslO [Geobacter sp. SVR]|uniref:Hsp33 family molecular chaperone HslO n=1 Tax=Geobacter sp. SVR TaxID=2495594 RepID=UPI00143F008D|nr:Hsp33 family molecular chaperone HslO [Geobacter sp. SVR]BCS51990.1 33 kDa chaperonin [Geobacter sp. SVR]GCF87195.1 33 kDa chaperonin [Geobacter sp. SVR]
MTDHIVRAVSTAGGIRVLACTAAQLAREVCTLQSTSATVSIALGRGLTGGALMGALLKPGQRVALKFEGNGPMGKMIIEADSDGAVRGSVGNPAAEMEPLNGRWNVPGILGKAGFLTVSKDLGFGGEPYLGTVQLRTSEIGDDLAYYLTDSEQVPSAVGLGATLDETCKITVCGGFLVQALPRADNEEIEQILAGIKGLPPLSSILQEGGAELLLKRIFGSVPYTLLETSDIFFRCRCTMDKVERALLSLGAEELRDMAAKENGTEVTCEFCRQIYRFDAPALEQLASRTSSSSSV